VKQSRRKEARQEEKLLKEVLARFTMNNGQRVNVNSFLIIMTGVTYDESMHVEGGRFV